MFLPPLSSARIVGSRSIVVHMMRDAITRRIRCWPPHPSDSPLIGGTRGGRSRGRLARARRRWEVERDVTIRNLAPQVVLAARRAHDLLAVLVRGRTEARLRQGSIVKMQASPARSSSIDEVVGVFIALPAPFRQRPPALVERDLRIDLEATWRHDRADDAEDDVPRVVEFRDRPARYFEAAGVQRLGQADDVLVEARRSSGSRLDEIAGGTIGSPTCGPASPGGTEPRTPAGVPWRRSARTL